MIKFLRDHFKEETSLNTYYYKIKIIPYEQNDYSLIFDACKEQCNALNILMSQVGCIYYTNNMSSDFSLIKQATNLHNPYFKQFKNPLIDKILISNQIMQDFYTAANNGLKEGKRTLPQYKFSNKLYVSGKHIKFSNKYGDDIENQWPKKEFEVVMLIDKPYCPHKYFKLVFGNPKKSKKIKEHIKNVIIGKEKRAEKSMISIENNELYLILALNIEKEPKTLDPNVIVGVDIGMSVPAVCAINNSEFKRAFLGDSDSMFRFRYKFEHQKRNLKHQLKYAHSGHGRTRKLESLTKLKNRVKNYLNNYYHNISKDIIAFAIKHNAGTINLENLSFSRDNEYNKRLLAYWGIEQLQEMITYKARENGIVVKFVDPKCTSIKCSKCGNINSEQRVSQKEFHCLKCGYHANADFNAARNISLTPNYVEDFSNI